MPVNGSLPGASAAASSGRDGSAAPLPPVVHHTQEHLEAPQHTMAQDRAFPRHVQLDERYLQRQDRERPWGSGSSVYFRSRSRSSFRSPSTNSRAHSSGPSGAQTPISPHSPRASISTLQLQHLLEDLELDQDETFGVEELRDGFFDASFYRPVERRPRNETIPYLPSQQTTFKRPTPLSLSEIYYNQVEDISYFFRTVFTTRQGISLAKSFLGYFIAYILCLIPRTQHVLGRYSYWITIVALFNHSGRTVGAQIEGTLACALGGAFGLAVGVLGLQVASSTELARDGYGGVLAVALFVFIGATSWLRCSHVRLYQGIMSAGIAVFFLCLVGSGSIETQDHWHRIRVRELAIPWMIGVGICLVVNMAIRPEAGGRAVAYDNQFYFFLSFPNLYLYGGVNNVSFIQLIESELTVSFKKTFRLALHNAIQASLEGLVLPRPYSPEVRRNMSLQLVNLSEAVRDMKIEITYSFLKPEDVEQLRNLLQAVIKDMMAVKPEAVLFVVPPSPMLEDEHVGKRKKEHEHRVVIDINTASDTDVESIASDSTTTSATKVIKSTMAGPARELVNMMTEVLLACDRELLKITGHPELLDHPPSPADVDIRSCHLHLREAIKRFDDADVSLIDHPDLPYSYSIHPELVELFLFIHPLRQAAEPIDSLAAKVTKLVDQPRRKRIYLPSYPWPKSLYRLNPQVRHDRGGLSAGYYFRSKQDIDEVMGKVHARAYVPAPDVLVSEEQREMEKRGQLPELQEIEKETLGYKIWKVLHRLQQFESRFALKVVLLTFMLSIPGWLGRDYKWYTRNESWWAVIAAWFMMHPRVGGNLQDLITRSIAVVLGAAWGGLAFASAKGNPYVMALFMAIFMIPSIFRYTSSSHPRSGLMACLSYSIVSISIYNNHADQSAVHIAWTRGLALIVGLVSAVVVNWILWPFVARHELRKSLSSMLLNLGVLYRGVVARYIYYEEGTETAPTKEDNEMSELQEARLREGFVRMRELLEMTRHEIRIRGPFDPTPYDAAIDSCELFLEHIIEVRKASLFFQPFLFGGSEEMGRKMISVRRDAVASILMNLYILASALRSKRPVPRYLPSAAVARKRLLDKMAEIEEENEALRAVTPKPEKSRRWADVYQYAYSAALTDIVEQLENLQQLTKSITGEMALDVPDF
ncbi:Zinc finger protein [Rhizina undulata]